MSEMNEDLLQEPESHTDAPAEVDHYQDEFDDDGAGPGLRVAPNNMEERLAFARREAANRSRDWTGYCQMFVRMSAGVPGLFASARAQWLGADAEDRHPGGHPSEAPVGSALCYYSLPYGHITLAARPFKSGGSATWGTDFVQYGHVDKHLRTGPTTGWGQPYLGYLTAVNDYDLTFPTPKPKQNKRYEAINTAINNLGVARDTARDQKDRDDVEVLTKEIQRLKEMYDRLRRY